MPQKLTLFCFVNVILLSLAGWLLSCPAEERSSIRPSYNFHQARACIFCMASTPIHFLFDCLCCFGIQFDLIKCCITSYTWLLQHVETGIQIYINHCSIWWYHIIFFPWSYFHNSFNLFWGVVEGLGRCFCDPNTWNRFSTLAYRIRVYYGWLIMAILWRIMKFFFY